jgi:alkylation response protein AidB-like acyl-CoA dehydrogenase
LDLVVTHVKQRHQFGVPIGSFQAVKHKAADMYVAIERARVLAYYSALTIAEDHPGQTRAALMAKAAAGECQQVVFANGFQLFGAMGFTWESELHVFLKRALAGDLLLGPAAAHRKALLALGKEAAA